MIKKKTIYSSTVTGKDYTSLEEAVRAEKEDETVCSLVDEFHKTMSSYKNEIEKINALCERMDNVTAQKLARLHDEFNSLLDSLTKQLHDLGFNVAEIAACDSCTADLENDKSPVKARKIKVRIIKKKLI